MQQKQLSQKQQEILTLLPRFRFLARTHIQSFLKHKDEARINKWLIYLIQNHYVIRRYDNAIIGRNKRPAIFFLGNNGVRFVNTFGIYDTNFIHKLYCDKKRSETFIEHCLMIATLCCALDKKQSDSIAYEYVTESDREDPHHPFHFLKELRLSVDLVVSKIEKGKRKRQYLLFYFDQTLPRYRLRNRIRKINELYFSSEWENTTGQKFPTVLLLFETKERMIYAKRYTKQLFEDEEMPADLSYNFAIAQDAKKEGITAAIWE